MKREEVRKNQEIEAEEACFERLPQFVCARPFVYKLLVPVPIILVPF